MSGARYGISDRRKRTDRGVADRLLEDRAAAGAQHAMHLLRHQPQVEVMQDRDAEHDVDRVVGKRQVVGRPDDEPGATRAAVHREPPRGQPNEVLGNVDAPDVRAASREQQRVGAGPAPEVDDALAGDVAEQVIRVLERKRGIGRRVVVARDLPLADAQRGVGCERRLDGTAFDLSAFPRVHLRLSCHRPVVVQTMNRCASPEHQNCDRVRVL